MAIATKDVLYFQDLVLSKHTGKALLKNEDGENDDDSLSFGFFDLANAKHVGYRIISRNNDNTVIIVRQDAGACGLHTGGIVWETSYLLLEYLLSCQKNLGRTLEVGAGCGMLGLALACSGWCKKVVLTETSEAMKNLRENVKLNESRLVRKGGKKLAVARRLQWHKCEEDVAAHPKNLRSHSFDTIVGTDVVFSPSFVEPLLQTMRLMSHDDTVVYLCLQVRCPDSHRLLLEKASKYQWQVTEITSDLASIPTCAWGLDMECRLLRLTTVAQVNGNRGRDSESTTRSRTGKRKKRKM